MYLVTNLCLLEYGPFNNEAFETAFKLQMQFQQRFILLPDYVAISNALQIPRTMYEHSDKMKNAVPTTFHLTAGLRCY